MNKVDKSIASIAKDLSKTEWFKEEEKREERANKAEAVVRENYSINSRLGYILMLIGFMVAMIGLAIFVMNYGEEIAGFKRWIMIGTIVIGGIVGGIGFLLVLQVGTLIILGGIAVIPVGIFLFYKGFITSWKTLAIVIGVALLTILFGVIIHGSIEGEVRDARREARK